MVKTTKPKQTKPQKKGFLSRLFTNKETSSPKKKATASPKKVVKPPDKKKITPHKTTKSTPVKKPLGKKVAAAPGKQQPSAPVKPPAMKVSPKPAPVKEFVVESSYTPDPFKGSSFILKPHKILTSEGWKRLVEHDPPFYT